ncbi:hypothetical protein [Dethiothermospora halolimnae]|uniref:hypothetical protein n=1 Tax=Dethiothermospora halolimnae TaxID=3114390 RepID=UPI003CCBC290
MTVWKTEFIKYSKFFGALLGIEVILDTCKYFNVIPIVGITDTVYSFWQMLSWIAIVLFVTYECFSFFYLGKDCLLHMISNNRHKVLIMKSAVFTCYMMGYFFIEFIRYMIFLQPNTVNSPIKLAFLYTISKFISILCFLSLLLALISLIKYLNNKIIGLIVLVVTYVSLTAFQAQLLYSNINQHTPVNWVIGIVDGTTGMNTYVNIVPIVFFPIKAIKFIENSFYGVSIIMNLVVLICCLSIFFIIGKASKFNFIKK